jgi:ABC-type Na+ efflux pump permease subunit
MPDLGSQLGKLLIVCGVALIVVGVLFVLGGKIPWLRFGRLPGDFSWGGGPVKVYFPLATSLVLSLLLTLLFWLFRR